MLQIEVSQKRTDLEELEESQVTAAVKIHVDLRNPLNRDLVPNIGHQKHDLLVVEYN